MERMRRLAGVRRPGSTVSFLNQGVQQDLHAAQRMVLSRDEETAYCGILQEAHAVHALSKQLRASTGTQPSLRQLAAALNHHNTARVAFVLRAAPAARHRLVLACKAHIVAQIQRLVSPSNRSLVFGAPTAGAGGRPANCSSLPIDDMFLAGIDGLLSAAHKFDARAGTRLLTYAHHHIVKALMAAVRSSAYSDVFIPRRTLELRGAVTRAMAEERSHGREARGLGAGVGGLRTDAGARGTASRSVACVASRLGVAPSAVEAVLSVSSMHVAHIGPGGGASEDGSMFEDVQLDKQALDRQVHDPHSHGSGEEPAGLHLHADGQSAAARDVAWRRLEALLQSELSEREVHVLCASMGLMQPTYGKGVGSAPEATPATTYEVARELGISHQAVSKLRRKALQRIRDACEVRPALASVLGELCEELAGAAARV